MPNTDPASITVIKTSRSRIRHIIPARVSAPCQTVRSGGPEDQRAIVVPGHDVQVAGPRPDALDVARLSGHEESTFRGANRREVPLAVAAQEQAVAGAHPSDFGLDAIEAPRQQQ